MTKVRKVRPRDKWGRFKKVTAQLSGAALGFISDNVPGLFEGAELAGDLYEMAYPEQLEPETDNTFHSKKSMYSGAVSAGKKASKTFMDVCQQYGATSVHENFGRIEDPHTVYIHQSSWYQDQISWVIRQALIRKVLEKANIQISSRSDKLYLEYSVAYPGNSFGFMLQFVTINPEGAYVSANYEFAGDLSLSGLTTSFLGFQVWMQDYLNDVIDTEPYSLTLFQRDTTNTGSYVYRTVSVLYLQNELIMLQMSSELKMQNRTAGDTAGAGVDVKAELDRVDSQPLIARLYEFRNGDMRLKSNSYTNAPSGSISNQPLMGQSPIGLRLVRAAVLDTAYQNRPNNNIWANCVGTKGFLLQPGEMKKINLSHSVEGKLTNIMKKLKAQTVLNDSVIGTIGHSQLICFEEKMRTVGTNLVNIHYERAYRIGCYFRTTKSAPIQAQFTSSVLNNLPA